MEEPRRCVFCPSSGTGPAPREEPAAMMWPRENTCGKGRAEAHACGLPGTGGIWGIPCPVPLCPIHAKEKEASDTLWIVEPGGDSGPPGAPHSHGHQVTETPGTLEIHTPQRDDESETTSWTIVMCRPAPSLPPPKFTRPPPHLPVLPTRKSRSGGGRVWACYT